MSSIAADRLARSECLGGYFDLQLTFAARMAERGRTPFTEAVARYTNLHRRFGQGDIDLVPPSAAWTNFLDQLDHLQSTEARVALARAVYARSPEEPPPVGQTAFGCFSCEAPNADGAVRLHFNNRDCDDEVGPLDQAKTGARSGELAALFGFVRERHPHARSVLGGSWLYNVEAYRRLFPPAYAASRHPPPSPLRLSGSSSWGQFLDHRGALKPDLAQWFLAGLDRLDPATPSRAFPLPALRAEAPVALFYGFYGV